MELVRHISLYIYFAADVVCDSQVFPSHVKCTAVDPPFKLMTGALESHDDKNRSLWNRTPADSVLIKGL